MSRFREYQDGAEPDLILVIFFVLLLLCGLIGLVGWADKTENPPCNQPYGCITVR